MSKRRRLQGATSSQAGSPRSSWLAIKNPQVDSTRSESTHLLSLLPHELFAQNILCDHFSLEELAVFDCALTNHDLRRYFGQVYGSIVLQRHTILKLDSVIKWIRSRGLHGKHFELWHGINKSNLQTFFKCGAFFETLNLTGYDYMTDSMLTKLSSGSPLLKSINLAYCSDLTDAGVASLAMNCRSLEQVVLWGCYELSNNALVSLATNCPRVQHLNLRCCRKITDEGLQMIVGGFASMLTLNFTYCRCITDRGVGYLAHAYPMLRRVSFAYCVLITDEAVRHLSHHCPYVESLDLTGCDISNESLLLIANSPIGRSLRELLISTCRNVTDLGLQVLGEKCKQLTAFHMAGCDQITLAGLRSLPATCVVHNPA
jgi:hypothetical protein